VIFAVENLLIMTKHILPLAALAFWAIQCSPSKSAGIPSAADSLTAAVVKPVVVTDAVQYDTDDPAIWINVADTAKSLIVGTDKDQNGSLFVFDLNGKIIPDKTVKGLKRPNNVDIEYGLILNQQPTDIAVTTERMTHKLRLFRLPDMKPVDNGGIEVFEGETGEGFRDLMGISLYKNPTDKKIYAIVGRKSGPREGSYLWQYLLEDDGHGLVKATLVRKFGKYSGKKEIESIAVDDELGYIYYSDEGVGVHKYYANPDQGNEELALFATTHFAADHEGISIYKINDGTGYILVSDQGGNHFNVYPREGTAKGPHDHPLLKIIPTSTQESDGSEVTSVSFPGKFKSGLFVGMSTDKTFQFYRWEDMAGKDLVIAPNGIAPAKK
jgi:3-phytase